MAEFSVRLADWARDHAALAQVRRTVFIDEQGVPEALEWDADDAVSVHFLAALADGTAIGCARLLPDGHAGRMAVLPAWRGRGVGKALLAAVIDEARARGHRALALSAQVHAAGFYARAGFTAVGEPYDEAGIPHVAMQKTLD
ncbi:MAG: GNAT family N-acetyltransferase [Pseudomonadota bacterium]